MKQLKRRIRGIGAVAILLAGTAAYGQDALGDGTALDRSLEVGRRVNKALPFVDYSYRNNLITGNVTGVGYFRGTVGYAAPAEFSDSSGSDDLFRFRARTAVTGGPVQLGTPPAIYYRTYAGTAARQRSGQSGNYPTQEMRSDVYGPGELPGSARVAQTVSLTELADGRVREITASPLLGVRRHMFDPKQALGLYEYLQDAAQTGEPSEEKAPEKSKPSENNAGAEATASSLERLWEPSLELGIRLDGRLEADLIKLDAVSINQRLDQIQEQLFQPLGAREAGSGEDVYMDLLDEVKRYGESVQPAAEVEGIADRLSQVMTKLPDSVQVSAAETGTAELGESDLKARVQAHLKAAQGNLGASGVTLEAPMPSQLLEAYQQRERAMREALGLPLEDPIDQLDSAEDIRKVMESKLQAAVAEGVEAEVVDPNVELKEALEMDVVPLEPEPAADATDDGLKQLLRTLDYRLPSLSTLAGKQRTRINRLLQEAEADLAEERYFDAEQNYRLILIGVPRHPMARVGVIHSQLGAGMIRSASVNLRQLLQQHPELIAARYEPKLLPQAKRLQKARREIEKLIKLSGSSDSALLLAYLGFQVNQGELVEYGLDLAQARNPHDPLVVLLRRIWLDHRPEPAKDDKVHDASPSAVEPDASAELGSAEDE